MSPRRYQLTPDIRQAICARIRKGAPAVAAALACGIPQEVFELWMRYGQARRPVRKYCDLYEGVRQAEALVLCEALMRAAQAPPTDIEPVSNTHTGGAHGAANLLATCREPALNHDEPAANHDESATNGQGTRSQCARDGGATARVG